MGRLNAAACYRELGAEMRKLREAAGLSGRQIGLRTSWDPTKISRIEHGLVNIDIADLTRYLGILRTEREVALPLVDLCRKAKEQNGYWLSAHGEWLPDSLSSLIYHEATANVTSSYDPQLVPGLLQTEGYARAMVSCQSWLSPAEVEAGVRVRLERQGVIARRDRRFVFYVHEHALQLVVGSPAVMYEQMVALTLAGALPNVDVRIVPASAGERSVVGEAFRVLEYDEYKPLVNICLIATTLFFEERSYVAPYQGLLPELAAVALGANESRSSIAALADKYDRQRIKQAAEELEEDFYSDGDDEVSA
jgi:transcriptional regulator with XRE-family HTH domain